MKRFVALLFLAASVLYVPIAGAAINQMAPAKAYPLSGTTPNAGMVPLQLKFRNTTAASSVARNALWTALSGYTDSTVFRHASALPTSYDTTISYPFTSLGLPPTFGPGYVPAIGDSLFPIAILRFGQDTLSYGAVASGITSALDSVRVALQVSDDNVNWYTCSGTPTYRFDTVFMTSDPVDGLQDPTLVGVELASMVDAVVIPFKCRLNQTNGATAMIANSPFLGQWRYFRFVFGGDYIGQFGAELLRWQTQGQ